MPRPKILYYAQDPGGTRYLDPAITTLFDEQEFDWSLVLHPFAKKSVLMDDRYAVCRSDFSNQLPARQSYFETVLADTNPDVIVCTTSAQARDASNSTLIDTARQLGIPCLAGLDHWKGLDRFFEGPYPKYFPDQLICIDDTTKAALGDSGLDTSRIHPVGHPGLEHIERNSTGRTKTPWRLLLVSQPIVQSGAYHGIYDEHINGHRLIDGIADALAAEIQNNTFDVYLRRHPKEHAGDALPAGINIDDIADWDAARTYYDVFVGFDSMALIEASLSGAPCVRMALPELADISDQPVPLDYGVLATKLKDLTGHIHDAVTHAATPGPNPFSGSTVRAATTIKTFVNSNL